MADDGLIAAYLRELDFSVARLADADDIVAEAEDHLREAAERPRRRRHAAAEAEAEAVARFGSAELVARVCAIEAKRGAAVPTTRTRQAGLAAILTPVLLVVGQYLNLNVPVEEGNAHGIGVALLDRRRSRRSSSGSGACGPATAGSAASARWRSSPP